MSMGVAFSVLPFGEQLLNFFKVSQIVSGIDMNATSGPPLYRIEVGVSRTNLSAKI